MKEELIINPPRRSNWVKEEGVKYLVAIDIDGTLVNHDGEMSEDVRTTLQQVVDAGHHVVISTGRSMGSTLPVVQAGGVTSGFAVSSNGAITLEITPEAEKGYKVIDRVCFNPSNAIKVLAERLPTASVAVEAPDGTMYGTADFQDGNFGVRTIRMSREEMAQIDQVVRLIIFDEQGAPADFKKAIYNVGLHGVSYAVGWSAWLDIAAHGVSKATALEQIRRKLGVEPCHTIAIGDGYNDKEMIHWAARGVAMGQAPAEVAELATDVTGSVYDDGTVPILRELL
ncbi:MAG: HAD family hydrolase [Rothia sp. (in: high G+C Gram-positive bacteria)]|nr:HAD family hydrolase [Rothia sp. (in: high G+C Gram-positive bacteria)]